MSDPIPIELEGRKQTWSWPVRCRRISNVSGDIAQCDCGRALLLRELMPERTVARHGPRFSVCQSCADVQNSSITAGYNA